jgi:hypothetical protein
VHLCGPTSLDGLPPISFDQPLEFTIGDYLAGKYTFDIFGIGDGSWTINFGVSDPVSGFDATQFLLHGTASDGSEEVLSEDILGPAPPHQVPEPPRLAIFVAGLLALVEYRRRHHTRPAPPSPGGCDAP